MKYLKNLHTVKWYLYNVYYTVSIAGYLADETSPTNFLLDTVVREKENKNISVRYTIHPENVINDVLSVHKVRLLIPEGSGYARMYSIKLSMMQHACLFCLIPLILCTHIFLKNLWKASTGNQSFLDRLPGVALILAWAGCRGWPPPPTPTACPRRVWHQGGWHTLRFFNCLKSSYFCWV